MRALWIPAVLLLALFLLGRVRVGGQAEFSARGFFVWARLGVFRLQVVPWKSGSRRPKKPKKKKKKQPKQDAKTKPKPKSKPPDPASREGGDSPRKAEKTEAKPSAPLLQRAGGALEYAQALLPVVLEAAGGVWRGLRVDKLELELTAGAPDPEDTVLLYGRASGALGALWEPLTQALHVKDGTARVQMDFQASGTTLYGTAALSIPIGCLVRAGLVNGIQLLLRAHAVKKRRKRTQRKAA